MFGIYCPKENKLSCQQWKVSEYGNLIILIDARLNSEDTKQIEMLFSSNGLSEEIYKKLKGPFVFVICDKEKRAISLMRDHFGEIPLYYTVFNKKIYFSTTITKILDETDGIFSLNEDVIHEYFMFRYISGKNTIYKNIYEVVPRKIVEIDSSFKISERVGFQFDYSEYGAVYDRYASNLFEGALMNSLKSTIDASNKKEVGFLSSGGIDSSILICKSKKIINSQFKTYYMGCENYQFNRYDEVDFISKINDTIHENIVVSNKRFADHLIETISINEEPLNHPCTVLQKYLYQKISKDVDVILSGEGADCLYCGYYIFDMINYFYVKNPLRTVTSFISKLIPVWVAPKKYQSKIEKIKNSFILPPDEYAIFFDLIACNRKEDLEQFLALEFPEDFAANYTSLFSGFTKKNVLNIILYIYQTLYLMEILNTNYKIGNHYNIEQRHPFIDLNVVNIFNKLPWNQKTSFFKRKPIISQLAKKSLPKEFIKKPKEGFGVPLSSWFYDEKGMGRYIELLSDSKTRNRGYFNKKFLDKILYKYVNKSMPDESFENIIWPIINFEMWNRIFIDRDLKGYK